MNTFLRILTQKDTGLNKRATALIELIRRAINSIRGDIVDIDTYLTTVATKTYADDADDAVKTYADDADDVVKTYVDEEVLWEEIEAGDFRLPTKAEWEEEIASWSSADDAGAFASPLKLPVAGNRDYSSGSLSDVGSLGDYWSSTVDGSYAYSLIFSSSTALVNSYYRADGFSVRLIKDTGDASSFVSETVIINGLTYKTVLNTATNRVWLDRNLGALQAATAKDDADSYGGLYQWGRATEGHEKRTSSVYDGDVNGLATTAEPIQGNDWDSKFITTSGDWLDTQDDTLWQGVSGTNNPGDYVYVYTETPSDLDMQGKRILNERNTQHIDGTGDTTKIGGADNYLEIEDDGTIRFVGDASVYKDINIGGISLTKAAANQPDLVTIDSTDILTYAFNGATSDEELHGAFELQHDYKEGTDLIPHAHFYPTTADAGDFKIFLDYWISVEGTTVESGTTSAVVSTNTTAWEQLRFNFDNVINGTNIKIGSQIHLRVYRTPADAQDTYPADVAIGTIGIHHEVDTIGSRGVVTK